MVCDRKFKRNDDDTSVPLGRELIQAYVKAITDIYYQQIALDLNKNPHPRGPIARQFLDTNTKKKTKCKRVEYEDRGKNTLNDRYTKNELLLLSQYFFEQDSTVGVRNHLCFLMSHAMLLRSETVLGTQYPNLFKMELEDQDVSPCVALVATIIYGKINKDRKI
ncbi:hypothetical protein PHYBLDRAFT_73845 [Phycomyces blakesleeanus NRRL 1555(-)]|uniref:Ndc10 domain-containing protein n=1 Tax=Phycomyces blakesleeanus (strain ATCC 8743b / DSM 1359 / FGSC 10004 / NBRC 33097 / NRRL 1555) TaxID=763407 RepID=A0A167KAW1_PHYB8|nr:hypothetical protein PHYBLDRAFT_73845 [Phycomyces blakesleeanus NRRL 1555(-)]OAD67637.1 hypothetical protein PHYBLDRAFT_73845 [Phycomyces blakesleeanus NRRL 1555(-)]|eukprot:XP_018285677.1 hypothetical protein PHYBLDRAFT_73845 [Phycomyces blakesleeanus NRRL 1555(-)]